MSEWVTVASGYCIFDLPFISIVELFRTRTFLREVGASGKRDTVDRSTVARGTVNGITVVRSYGR